ncbi:MAG: GspE/PulE family protein [Clostridium sp.]
MVIDNLIKEVDLEVLYRFSKERAIREEVVPICIKDGFLKVVSTSNNYNEKYLNFCYARNVKQLVIHEKEFHELLERLFIGNDKDCVKKIVEIGIKVKASDIHFEPYKTYVNIRVRLNGDLNLLTKITRIQYDEVIRKIKLDANLDIIQTRVPQDGKGIYTYENNSYDCRVSTIPTLHGEKVVMRILKGDRETLELKSLRFSKSDLKEIEKMLKVKNGMVLISGPTGSGKSTTLYSMVSSLDKDRFNITTIEDPIEIYIDDIVQVSLDRSVNMGFSEALRSILRQDPDQIVVGEARDLETARIAIRASLTGHKIFTTIHTKSPLESITRFEEMGIEDYSVRNAIVGIVSQRLVKTLCNDCKEEDVNHNLGYKIYRKKGCNKCSGTGYLKRKVIASCYYMDEDIKRKLKSKDYDEDFLSNKPMVQNLVKSLENGEISYEDYKEFIYGEELIGYDEILKR